MPNGGNLSLVEELSYSTVRVVAMSVTEEWYGTGFFMLFKETQTQAIPVLVTNGHVLDGAIAVRLCFSVENNGAPSSETFVESIGIGAGVVRFHPAYLVDKSVDLCAMPIAPFIHSAERTGKKLFYRATSMNMLAEERDLEELMQLDEVTMIGYPNAIIDEANNQPIFRRGVLATNPSLDYDGKKEFLTDIATIGGSSGSPVYIIREGFSHNRRTGAISISSAQTCQLIGVHRGGFRYGANGCLVKIDIPERVDIASVTQIPINLGIAIKAFRIRELEQLF